MAHTRIERVEELIKEQLAKIIQKDLADPRIGFATVAHVKMSKDLRSAVVGVSFLNDEAGAVAAALEALEHATGFIRRALGQNVRLKFLPDLHFVHDGSAAYASRIQVVLNQIKPAEGWEAEPQDQDNV